MAGTVGDGWMDGRKKARDGFFILSSSSFGAKEEGMRASISLLLLILLLA